MPLKSHRLWGTPRLGSECPVAPRQAGNSCPIWPPCIGTRPVQMCSPPLMAGKWVTYSVYSYVYTYAHILSLVSSPILILAGAFRFYWCPILSFIFAGPKGAVNYGGAHLNAYGYTGAPFCRLFSLAPRGRGLRQGPSQYWVALLAPPVFRNLYLDCSRGTPL